jgi:hypothetical protein
VKCLLAVRAQEVLADDDLHIGSRAQSPSGFSYAIVRKYGTYLTRGHSLLGTVAGGLLKSVR